jgi:hypothetical protein
VLYINKQFEGLLMYRDINYDSVSPRFATEADHRGPA